MMKQLWLLLAYLITATGQSADDIPFFVRSLIDAPDNTQCKERDISIIKGAIFDNAIPSYERMAKVKAEWEDKMPPTQSGKKEKKWNSKKNSTMTATMATIEEQMRTHPGSKWSSFFSASAGMTTHNFFSGGGRDRRESDRRLRIRAAVDCSTVCCSFTYGTCYTDYPTCTGHPKSYVDCPVIIKKTRQLAIDDDQIFRAEEVKFGSFHVVKKHTVTVEDDDTDFLIVLACKVRIAEIIDAMWSEHKRLSASCVESLNFSMTLQCVWK